MAEQRRMSLLVDDDIPDKLAVLAGSPRKMGEYLNDLVRELYLERENPTGEEVKSTQTEVEIYLSVTRNMWDRVKELEKRVELLEKK